MPTKPPHHVSSFIFRISGLSRISTFGFGISPDLSGRIIRNEPISSLPRCPKVSPEHRGTQFTPAPPGPGPKYAKRTQSHKANGQKMRNKPNSRTACLLPAPIRPFTRNEPNPRWQQPRPHPPTTNYQTTNYEL